MPQEYFDIVNEDNIPTGEIMSRTKVHNENIHWHRTVNIWIANDRGEFLCQQRSWKKDANPGMWMSFFGGHVKAGQTVEESLQDELLEEIGIDIQGMDKKPSFVHIGVGKNNKHFGYTYFFHWNGSIEDLSFHDGEVERVAWMNMTTLQLKINSGDFCNSIGSNILKYLDESRMYKE